MAYNDQERSIAEGAPFYLYEFNTAGQVYRYTDCPVEITWNSLNWSPFPIKHTEVKQSSELSKNSLTVTIPIMGEFADIFVGWSPDHIVTFTLRRGHFGSTDALVYWKGRVSSHNLKNSTIELKCESIFTSMRRAGIRARFQRNCRHAVYSKGCGLDKSNFVVEGSLSSIVGLVLTVPEAATEPDNWFQGGIIEFYDGSFRMVLSHTGDQLRISRASRYAIDALINAGYGLSYGEYYGGVSVKLYPGCDRTINTCKTKFNNLDNQGGFKWIPSKNPMTGSSIV